MLADILKYESLLRIIDTQKKGQQKAYPVYRPPSLRTDFFLRGGEVCIQATEGAELQKMAEDFAGYVKKKQTICCLKTEQE